MNKNRVCIINLKLFFKRKCLCFTSKHFVLMIVSSTYLLNFYACLNLLMVQRFCNSYFSFQMKFSLTEEGIYEL